MESSGTEETPSQITTRSARTFGVDRLSDSGPSTGSVAGPFDLAAPLETAPTVEDMEPQSTLESDSAAQTRIRDAFPLKAASRGYDILQISSNLVHFLHRFEDMVALRSKIASSYPINIHPRSVPCLG